MLGAPHRPTVTNGLPCAPTRPPTRPDPRPSRRAGGARTPQGELGGHKVRRSARSARTALAPHHLRSTSFVRSAKILTDDDDLLGQRSRAASSCAAQQDTQRSGASLGGRRVPRRTVEGRRSAGGGSGAPTRTVAPSVKIEGGSSKTSLFLAQLRQRFGFLVLSGSQSPVHVTQSGGKHLESRDHHWGQSGEKPGKEQGEVRFWRVAETRPRCRTGSSAASGVYELV